MQINTFSIGYFKRILNAVHVNIENYQALFAHDYSQYSKIIENDLYRTANRQLM